MTDPARSNMPLVLFGEGRDCTALNDAQIWDAVSDRGAVLFHGFHVDADDFYAFASRFNRAFLTSPFDDRKTLSDKNELQTVTLGQFGLTLHFEYGNSPLRPDLLWFYCRRPPAAGQGGETLVADGAAIFDKLSPSTQDMLLNRRIKYTNFVPRDAFDAITNESGMKSIVGNNALDAMAASGASKILEASDQRIVYEYVASSVCTPSNGRRHICQNCFGDPYKRPSDKDAEKSFSTVVTWEDGSDIEKAVVDELRLAAGSATRGIKWRAEDFVLIDNNRVMHGRRPTKDPERDIVLLCSFSTRYQLAA